MATNFERVRSVIEALLPAAQNNIQNGGDVDTFVQQRLAMLSSAYGGGMLNSDRPAIDYSKLTTHIAYAYRSLAAHGDWLHKMLCQQTSAVKRTLDVPSPHVACIGGGPGSDILGVIKFARQWGLGDRTFRFTILDHHPQWWRCRDELVSTFDDQPPITHTHQDLDLSAGSPWTDDWQFCSADLFTLSFCLSEVWSFNAQGSVSGFLDQVISGAKAGALFCYLDNGGSNFSSRIDAEMCKRNDLVTLLDEEHGHMVMSYSERADVVKIPFQARFGGQWPKLKGEVATKIWKKK
ncbi:hypothetical protein [uncultured Parasphingopyxis sp.]|uniref:hypothetical protein n=1 Tax=uncultured Parasphingopyxis sp. TaxID=1547918 RepID=UPI002606F3DF|nr:hypothetical protein [uncultured Parasphingopyxis sp.]